MPPSNIVPYGDKWPQIHPEAFIDPASRITGDVVIGKGAGIWSGAVIRGDDAQVVIGEGAMVLENCVVEAPGFKAIVGERAIVSHGAVIHGATVGARSVIGIGATLLDGSSVGEDCVVGSGAVVPPGSQIPSGKLALGLPAKVIRDTTPQDIESGSREMDSLVRKVKVYDDYFKKGRPA